MKKKDKLQEPSASGTPETNVSGEENGLEEISLEEAFGMLDEITRSLEKEAFRWRIPSVPIKRVWIC